MALSSMTWGYARIIAGTLLGGALGFYVMHRIEVSYKVCFFSLSSYEKACARPQTVGFYADEDGGSVESIREGYAEETRRRKSYSDQ